MERSIWIVIGKIGVWLVGWYHIRAFGFREERLGCCVWEINSVLAKCFEPRRSEDREWRIHLEIK
jgi:hypothetical protein